MSDKRIASKQWPPLHPVDHGDEQRLLATLRQANWSNGEQVEECEQRLAEFCGCKYALLVVNATAALKIGLLATGVRPGDEVIVSGMTWPSTIIAVMECGADPVPVDIDSRTYGLSVDDVRSAITGKTRAIIPTHLFCSQTDLPPLLELASTRNIRVIEDAAQAIGTRRFGRALGTFGDAGIFSFNQKKVLTCGEGGCLVTNDEALFTKALALREVDPDIDATPEKLPGCYKISEFQAAVLLTQLEKLPSRLKLIEENAEFLRSHLSRVDRIEVLERLPGTDLQTFYNFCFKMHGVFDIEQFRKALSKELCLSVGGAYPPINKTRSLDTTLDKRYKGLGKMLVKSLPSCEKAHYREAVRIPYNVLMADRKQVEYVADSIVGT